MFVDVKLDETGRVWPMALATMKWGKKMSLDDLGGTKIVFPIPFFDYGDIIRCM